MELFKTDELFDTKIISGGTPFDKIGEAFRISTEIVENLSPAALKQLHSGYERDLEVLLKAIMTETYLTLYGNVKDPYSTIGTISSGNLFYLEKLCETMDDVLKNESLLYFLMNVMEGFELNWHHMEWADMVQSHKYICCLAARDHGKSYFYSNGYAAWKLWRYNKDSKRKELSSLGREGWIFSFSKTQATRLLTTLKESIEDIPQLREKLFPGKSDGWAATSIKCKNGTKVTVGSAGESTRGAHPGWEVVDDFLKDNVMYSSEQRKKLTTYFHSVIMNMIQPGGQVIVVGTPFHSQDLYGDLRGKKGWHYREYPSIFPDGRLLWRRRYDFKSLMEKKETQGMINFSREHLCRPISSDSSIFPFTILQRALAGTQHICMVKNRESFPIKLKRWGIGVDLAISAKIGADYTVMVVGGMDEEDNIWIVNVVRLHGASYQEQISKLKMMNIAFKPDIIQIESNGFQQIFGELANAKENMPIINKPTTTKTKYDATTGLPGLALLFERGKVKIPHGDEYSVNIKDEMFAELSSITFTDKGLKATLGHDDIPMAMHQLLRGLSYGNNNFGFSFI